MSAVKLYDFMNDEPPRSYIVQIDLEDEVLQYYEGRNYLAAIVRARKDIKEKINKLSDIDLELAEHFERLFKEGGLE